MQGIHISQVKEHKSEDSLNISFLFQSHLLEGNVPYFSTAFESTNIDSQSNETNLINQLNKVLGNHHSDDDDYVDVHGDEFPNAPTDLLVSQEDSILKDLDLESHSVKEDVLMKNSSSPPYPACSTICNASICDEDTPCSSSS